MAQNPIIINSGVTTHEDVLNDMNANFSDSESRLSSLELVSGYGIVSGDNISLLVNNENYIASGDNVSFLNNDAGYITDAVQSGDNVSLLANDENYVASGDNVSLLNNDANYSISGHTHPLTDLEQGGATDGQSIVWDTGSNSWVAQTPAGGGDMLASTYDPTNVTGDVFDMDNMVEGTTSKILTTGERDQLANLGTMANASAGDYTLTGHTHSLADLTQDGATDGQAIVWNTGSGAWIADTIAGGSTSTLSATSSVSTDTAKSLYTMTSGVPVEFESNDNNTLLYLDETNEKVGVGTAAPSGQLHIAGTSEPEFIIDALAGGPDVSFALVGDIKSKIYYESTTDGLNFTVNDSNVGIDYDGTSNFFIRDGGYIGIGTAQPDAYLNINHSGVGGQEFLKINCVDSAGRPITFYDAGTFVGGIDYNFSANTFSFDVTDASNVRQTDAFVIKSESNDNFIGIGTNTPDAKVHISGGSIKIVDGTEGSGKVLTSDADGLSSWETLDYVSSGDNISLLTNDENYISSTQQLLPNVSGAFTFDNSLGGNALITLTNDVTSFSITNSTSGDNGLMVVKQGNTPTPFTFSSTYDVLVGDLADIALITPSGSGAASIGWYDDGSDFYLYVSNYT